MRWNRNRENLERYGDYKKNIFRGHPLVAEAFQSRKHFFPSCVPNLTDIRNDDLPSNSISFALCLSARNGSDCTLIRVGFKNVKRLLFYVATWDRRAINSEFRVYLAYKFRTFHDFSMQLTANSYASHDYLSQHSLGSTNGNHSITSCPRTIQRRIEP